MCDVCLLSIHTWFNWILTWLCDRFSYVYAGLLRHNGKVSSSILESQFCAWYIAVVDVFALWICMCRNSLVWNYYNAGKRDVPIPIYIENTYILIQNTTAYSRGAIQQSSSIGLYNGLVSTGCMIWQFDDWLILHFQEMYIYIYIYQLCLQTNKRFHWYPKHICTTSWPPKKLQRADQSWKPHSRHFF